MDPKAPPPPPEVDGLFGTKSQKKSGDPFAPKGFERVQEGLSWQAKQDPMNIQMHLHETRHRTAGRLRAFVCRLTFTAFAFTTFALFFTIA